MKSKVRAALEEAEQKQPRTVVFSEKERHLVAHMIRYDLKACTNPAAIEVLVSALAKLDAAGNIR